MQAGPVARFLSTLRRGGEGSGFAHHLGQPGMRGGLAAAAHNDQGGGGAEPRIPVTRIPGTEIQGDDNDALRKSVTAYYRQHFTAGSNRAGHTIPLPVKNDSTGWTINLSLNGVGMRSRARWAIPCAWCQPCRAY